jgi:hypothetical protein
LLGVLSFVELVLESVDFSEDFSDAFSVDVSLVDLAVEEDVSLEPLFLA